jgi:uncharacterized protein (TIGR02246 family)
MAASDVVALHEALVAAIEKQDAALIASLYAPDAHLLPPGSEAVEGPGIEAFWQGFLDMGVTGGRLQDVRFEERDDLVVAEGWYQVHGDSGVLDTGKYVDVAKRQPDGSWKWVIDIFNSNAAPPA